MARPDALFLSSLDHHQLPFEAVIAVAREHLADQFLRHIHQGVAVFYINAPQRMPGDVGVMGEGPDHVSRAQAVIPAEAERQAHHAALVRNGRSLSARSAPGTLLRKWFFAAYGPGLTPARFQLSG